MFYANKNTPTEHIAVPQMYFSHLLPHHVARPHKSKDLLPDQSISH